MHSRRQCRHQKTCASTNGLCRISREHEKESKRSVPTTSPACSLSSRVVLGRYWTDSGAFYYADIPFHHNLSAMAATYKPGATMQDAWPWGVSMAHSAPARHTHTLQCAAHSNLPRHTQIVQCAGQIDVREKQNRMCAGQIPGCKCA